MDKFLSEQSSDGSLDSSGGFTLDLAKAADKLADFALPSENHYLLKMIQVAHRLKATSLHVKIERYRTVLRFRASMAGPITEPEAVMRALSDPLAVVDPVMTDFILGLVGTITDNNLETLWSFSEGHLGQRMFIDGERRFTIEPFTLKKPKLEEEEVFAFTLSVLHPKTWKFWSDGAKAARRRAASLELLEKSCAYSAIPIFVDSRELPTESCSVLNRGVRRGVVSWFEGREYIEFQQEAASLLAFHLTEKDELGFRMTRPSLSSYVVRDHDLNLWASGTRVTNSLFPDGANTPAWSFLFLRGAESLVMREIPKSLQCRAVVALNLNNEGSENRVKIRVVRSGVLVNYDSSEFSLSPLGRELKGCSLIFADEECETDLTGFQIIQNDDFTKRVTQAVKFLPKAREYYARATKFITLPD